MFFNRAVTNLNTATENHFFEKIFLSKGFPRGMGSLIFFSPWLVLYGTGNDVLLYKGSHLQRHSYWWTLL